MHHMKQMDSYENEIEKALVFLLSIKEAEPIWLLWNKKFIIITGPYTIMGEAKSMKSDDQGKQDLKEEMVKKWMKGYCLQIWWLPEIAVCH